jgi:hypothetical protein
MASQPDEAYEVIQSALEALKRGDRTVARSLAKYATSLAPESETPWLILAALADPEEEIVYIKKALRINPESKQAQNALERTFKRQRDHPPALASNPPPGPTRPAAGPDILGDTAPHVPQSRSPAGSPLPVEASPQPKSYAGQISLTPSPDILGDTAPHASQSRSPATGRKKSSPSTILILGLSLLGVLVFAGLLALFFGGRLLGGLSQAAQPLQLAPASPTLSIPTPACGPPTLVLGSTTYQIQTLTPAPDGSLPVPSNTSGIAYWMNGMNTNYVFVLSPTPDNLALQTELPTGDLATLNWTDCTTISFTVSAIQGGQLSDPTLLDQSIPGISVFVQTDPSIAGFMVRGKLAEETVSVLDTPMPDESGILAEISLLDSSTSPDGTNIKVAISILNYGQSPFTLSPNNVSLTPEDAAPLVIISSEPPLPKEIAPAVTETFTFTFPRPSVPTVTLEVFTVEYDIEGY